MGYYINNLADGRQLPVQGKADFLLANVEGAKEVEKPTAETYNPEMVCVVENPQFDAAAWAYNLNEALYFAAEDEKIRSKKRVPFEDLALVINIGSDEPRPTRWLIVPGVKEIAA